MLHLLVWNRSSYRYCCWEVSCRDLSWKQMYPDSDLAWNPYQVQAGMPRLPAPCPYGAKWTRGLLAWPNLPILWHAYLTFSLAAMEGFWEIFSIWKRYDECHTKIDLFEVWEIGKFWSSIGYKCSPDSPLGISDGNMLLGSNTPGCHQGNICSLLVKVLSISHSGWKKF